MTLEQFPFRVDYQTENTRPEWQGAPNSCTRFGGTSALECAADRAGFPIQLSVRYLWYFTDKAHLSVQNFVDCINLFGTCRDDLCPYVANMDPPYDVKDIDVPPSFEAMEDARSRKFNIKIERLAGQEECMRALAQGYPLIICRTQPGGEHVEAVIGYDRVQGLKVHGSGWAIYWEPWSSVSDGTITQIWRLYDTPWPAVPHPDYIEGDLPSLQDGILTLPRVNVWRGWDFEPRSLNFKNVVFQMLECNPVADSPDVRGFVFWHSTKFTLYIPKMLIDGLVAFNVTITNPVAELISAEEA